MIRTNLTDGADPPQFHKARWDSQARRFRRYYYSVQMRLISSRQHSAHPKQRPARKAFNMPNTPIKAHASPGRTCARPNAGAGQIRSHLHRQPGGTFVPARASNTHIGSGPRTAASTMPVSLLCGLSAWPTAIPRRFDSSLLPPWFAAGRHTAVFTSARRTGCSAPASGAAR